jgi:4-amino-4-deoxy-L-arabinose transferase-like glycosyltransferase
METNTTQAIDTADGTTTPGAKRPAPPSRSGFRQTLLTWFTAWELYPVVLVAAFLRFYQLSFTEFDTDQAVLWNMAHVALTQRLIPATGNLSSIGTVNPPGFTYILMSVGIFTDNPLAGALLVAALNVLAVILTYAFTRRYYGRLAGFVAAALTATAIAMVLYSRFIWQPNVLAPLMVLYMLALFRGAVAQRPGWFAPAALLLGLALQLSGSSIYLVPVLLLALLLGYKTVRWRDLALGVALVAVLFSTYLVWEAATGYADLPLLLGTSGKHATIDGQAFAAYARFLSAYSAGPASPQLFFTRISLLMYLHQLTMLLLISASFLLLLLGLFWKHVQLMVRGAAEQIAARVPGDTNTGLWRTLWQRWNAFVASPERRGLLLLLAWQLLPLILFSRHSIAVQVHYLLILMPGPFILIGLLVSQVTTWGVSLAGQGKTLRLVIPALAVLLILVQTLGSLAWLLDNTDGKQVVTTNYNSLLDLNNALHSADQLAQTHHLHHVYIDTDARTVDALSYLAGHMQTPYTLINSRGSHCLLLPGTTLGPAIILFGPSETLDEMLMMRFTSATLLSAPPRLGGAPFHVYLVQPLRSSSGTTITSNALTLAQKRSILLDWHNPATPLQPVQRLLATFWSNAIWRPAASGSWWMYHFAASYSGNGTNGQSGVVDCRLTSLQPGEQLIIPFAAPTEGSTLPASLAISGTITSATPFILSDGPLHFQTLRARLALLGTFQGIAAG